ncbi:MAG: methionyl-tRNA formyltransferase [Christensenellaceae bacterium]
MMEKVIIATIKSWNIENAQKFKEIYKDCVDVEIVTDHKILTTEFVQKIKPKYLFFPHWSYKIPADIYENYECIVFHTGDLPQDRGGSPIQNQIAKQKYDTKICAIRVVEGFDEGDIYLKKNVDLSCGTVDDILKNISNIVFSELIPQIISEKIIPIQQQGEPSSFKRRTPQMSDLLTCSFEHIQQVYDFVRMLDGEGYPKAFLETENFRMELSDARMEDGKCSGRFELTIKNKEE